MSVHSSAIVSSMAQIGPDVQIGPFCVVESGAVIGSGCVLDGRVTVKQGTTLGTNNHVSEGGYPRRIAAARSRPGKSRPRGDRLEQRHP